MKTLKTFIVLIAVVGFMSCADNKEISSSTVDQYIELLKANQYDSLNLPAFTYQDIPALLAYRNDTRVITNFPHNPISSMYAPDCTLGMYVLWTIESIRAVAIQSDRLIQRFPSQNPILALRESPEMTLVYDNLSQEVVAKAYNDWWQNNEKTTFKDFKTIDPLAGTSYKWH